MQDDKLIQKIMEMHQYCTPEGIATALKIPLDAVIAVLDGKPIKIENKQVGEKPIMLVKATASVHRQKCIGIVRTKGGVGVSTLVTHLAALLADKLTVLLIDLNPNGGDTKQYVIDRGLQLGQTESLVTIRFTDNLHFHYPQSGEIKDISHLNKTILLAKNSFDVVLLDLPLLSLKDLQEINQQCNSAVVLFDTTLQGIEKLLSWQYLSTIKDKYLVVNNCRGIEASEKVLQQIIEQFDQYNIHEGIYLPYAPELTAAFSRGDFINHKSPYIEGIRSLSEVVFPGLIISSKKNDGLFSKLSRLIGGGN